MVSKVFKICTAYEQGFGKGSQGQECVNPYYKFVDFPECLNNDLNEAWDIGYEEGRAARERRLTSEALWDNLL